MRHAPAISVLLSVFNGRLFLAEAVESILGQTFGDFEFLIIDDGSTDGSLEMLRRYERQDPRIRLTSRPNKGVTRTLNELFRQSKGDFIARMDADDVARSDRLALQYAAMRDDPSLACLGSSFLLIDKSGRALTVLAPPTGDSEIQQLCLAGHTAICHPTAMIRRSSMALVGGYCEDFGTAQDLDLWLRLGELGKLANLSEPLLKFRVHESSVSETKRYDQYRSMRLACERAWQRRGIVGGQFEPQEPWRPGKDSASQIKFALRYGWWAFNSGHRWTALHYGIRAIGTAPQNVDGWKLLLSAAVKPIGPAPSNRSAERRRALADTHLGAQTGD